MPKSSPQVPSAEFGFSTHNLQKQHRKQSKIPVLCLIAADCRRHTESGVNPTVARRQKPTLLPQQESSNTRIHQHLHMEQSGRT